MKMGRSVGSYIDAGGGGSWGCSSAATHDGTSRHVLRSSKCAQSFLLDLRCLFGSIGEAARMGRVLS